MSTENLLKILDLARFARYFLQQRTLENPGGEVRLLTVLVTLVFCGMKVLAVVITDSQLIEIYVQQMCAVIVIQWQKNCVGCQLILESGVAEGAVCTFRRGVEIRSGQLPDNWMHTGACPVDYCADTVILAKNLVTV